MGGGSFPGSSTMRIRLYISIEVGAILGVNPREFYTTEAKMENSARVMFSSQLKFILEITVTFPRDRYISTQSKSE